MNNHEAIAEKVMAGEFEEMFFLMTIRNISNTRSYSGSGLIRQHDQNCFEIILLDTNHKENEVKAFVRQIGENLKKNEEAGKLYSEDDIFLLQTDSWQCDNLLDLRIASCSTGTIIKAFTARLYMRVKVASSTYGSVTYYFPEKLPFPKHEVTTKVEWLGKKEPETFNSWNLDSALVETEVYRLQMRERKEMTFFNLSIKKDDAGIFLMYRPLEALEFFLGRELFWCLQVHHRNDVETTQIQVTPTRKLLCRPSASYVLPDIAKHGWTELYLKYLDFMTSVQKDDSPSEFHAVIINSLKMFSKYLIQEYAMLLSVSVEHILSRYFPSPIERTEAFRNCIENTVARIRQETNLSNDEKMLIENHVGRLTSGYKSMKKILKELESDLIILGGCEEAWTKIRNTLSHGMKLESTQENLNLVGKVQTCLNQLIFALIKYNGPFINYSTIGHPVYQLRDGQYVCISKSKRDDEKSCDQKELPAVTKSKDV
jgi:hypothetical protein